MRRVVLIVSLLLSAALLAQDHPVLTRLQSDLLSMNSFQVSFKQGQKGMKEYAGKYYFKKEKRSRIELGETYLITDGTTLWTYHKKRKKVIISKYTDRDPSLMSFPVLIKDYPSKCAVTEIKVGAGWQVALKPKDNSLQFSSAVIDVGEDYSIKKIEITALNNQKMVIRFSDFIKNPNLADNLFTYQTQKGDQVIDLR